MLLCGICAACLVGIMVVYGEYELATAFETIYFWPGLEKCFAEVARILKPGVRSQGSLNPAVFL